MSEPIKVNSPESNEKGIHFDFIKNTIPEYLIQASPLRRKVLKATKPTLSQWYENSSTDQQRVLKRLIEADGHAQNKWDKTIEAVQNITAYAKPLLTAALAEAGVDLDVEKIWLRLYYPVEFKFFGIPVGVNTGDVRARTFSLLQAALHNFESFEAEEGYFDKDSSFITEPDARGHFDVVQLTLKIQQFVTICRKLDVGGQYNKYVKNFLYEGETAHQQALSLAFINSKKTAMKSAAYAALLKDDIELKHYELLVELINEQDIVKDKDSQRRISYSPLQLMGYEIAECALFFPTHTNRFDGSYVIAYIPDDPEHPIKKYASFADFEEELTHQLMDRPQGSRIDSGRDVLTDYQRFFSRFVSEKDRARFFLRFTQKVLDSPSGTYWKDQVRGYLKYLSPVSRLVGPLDDRHWRRDPLENIDLHAELSLNFQWIGMAGIWTEMFRQKRRHMLEDAQVLAVSTAAEDDITRERRLSNYLNIGMSLVGIAAFLVPPVGAAMLLVTADQLLFETIEGVRELSQGDKEAGWAHITDVLENLATMVALAPVFHYTVSPFIEGLKPVTLPSGKTRLWKPDLKPYEHKATLLPGLKPNEQGLYQQGGKTILPLEGKNYAVKSDPVTGTYQVQHPSRVDAYTPKLKTNGAGAWSHETEQPRTWEGLTLMRRLGHVVEGFSDAELEQIRRVSGTDEGMLRRMHVDNELPAPLLADTISRFDAYKQVEKFISDLESNDAAIYTQVDPITQLHVMTGYSRWPDAVSIRVIDAQANTVWEYSQPNTAQSDPRVVQVHNAQIQGGKLLGTVMESLTDSETNTLLDWKPGTPRQPLEKRVTALRENIAKTAETHKAQLFNDHYASKTASNDPRVNLIKGRFSNVPTRVIENLLEEASSTDRQHMSKWDFADKKQTKPIPLRLAEALRWVQREVRLSRAYEGLYLDALMSADTENLVLNTLEKLPGWSNGLRIEVRDGSFNGKVRASVGHADAASRKVLVRNKDGLYEPRDQQDGHLHGADDLYAALQHALPDAHRNALGLPHVSQGPELKTLIGTHAVSRPALRSLLNMQPIKPFFKAPSRVSGGRPGYPLSGRGQGASRFSAKDQNRALQLYPDLTAEQVDAFLGALEPRREFYLSTLEAELVTLESELETWKSIPSERLLEDGSTVPVDEYDKKAVAALIRNCWQRRGGPEIGARGNEVGYRLRLNSRPVGELPRLSASFNHVRFLEMRGMELEAPNDFLGAFKKLSHLKLEDNRLTDFPMKIGEMTELQILDLSRNLIELTPQAAQSLAGMRRLQKLSLNHNPVSRLPDFSQMINLREVRLQGTGIDQWPIGLRDQAALKLVDLRDNRLTTVPEVIVTPPSEHVSATNKVMRITELNGNPLSAEGMQNYADVLVRVFLDQPMTEGPIPDAPQGPGVARGEARLAPSAQRMERWLKDLPADERGARIEQWQLLDSEALGREALGGETGQRVSVSEAFFRLLEKMSSTAEYKKAYSDLKARVWTVLDAAARSEELRARLFELAGDETCSDRAALVFSELEVQVLIDNAETLASNHSSGVELIRLAKGLFRLDEVEKLALQDIKTRIASIIQSGLSVRQKGSQLLMMDQIEVRLSYRVGLREKLELPGQPKQADYTGTNYVSQGQLDAAEAHVKSLENSPAEFESIIQRGFWGEYLRAKYPAKFEAAYEVIYTEQEQLDAIADTVSTAEYERRSNELLAKYNTLTQSGIRLLTPQEILDLEGAGGA
ncbi:NEL-type E3 ubiquitin ligase domain-containing protein [Pseudomonas fluorescens]|uniref:RING-type E3 ubiquitin transferase n=1 Tax=Pseudomonas fluorescens TaxID=294 RepID=A0A5E7D2S9_PSEFL|nr:NEL-type E3 ubiquitin ligase domain-containing protein [Pseudomonas fluorescens]VVO01882.1 hypothetical protein PS723_02704 [Pseudomonas fluorescens]